MPVVLFNKVIISDTSCLIGFTNIGKLEILHKLCKEITITPEIAKEYGDILPEWIHILPVKDTQKTAAFIQTLDIGEASALALALETENALVVIDDKQARKFAQKLGIPLTGTLGLIYAAQEKGLIDNVQPIINELRSLNFRLPK